jgi:hypothetical protein
MTDDTDNVIDVTGKLPDPNLHTRWRKRLPDFYLQELDKLKAQYDALDEMAKDLTAFRGRLLDGISRVAACSDASAAADNIRDSRPGRMRQRSRSSAPSPAGRGISQQALIAEGLNYVLMKYRERAVAR